VTNLLRIYVDSSTKPSNGTKYGESSAAWGFQWDNGTVFWRGGAVYLRHAGPNKMFYEGVIRALESALPDVNNGSGDRLEVYGDCQTVINQLNGVWRVGQLRKHYDRVRAVERKIKKRVTYHYLGETDATYKKVDILSKQGRDLFSRLLK